MKIDREWFKKREAIRGQPHWQYVEVWTVEDVLKEYAMGEVPIGASINEQGITWYGWAKDDKGPAEMWYLVNYVSENDTQTQKPE